MAENVGKILAKQLLAIGAAIALVVVVLLGVGWILAKRSGPKAPTVPFSVVEDCRAAIRSRMANPGTVKFLVGGLSTQVRENGGYLVRLSYKASNAYGMESEMKGLCVYPPGGGPPDVYPDWK